MATCLFIEMHIVCMVLFFYVYLVVRKQSCSGRFARCINTYIAMGALSSFLEIVAALIKEAQGPTNLPAMYLCIAISHTTIAQLGFVWLVIVGVLQNSKKILRMGFLIAAYVPTFVISVLLCTSPWTHLIFWFEEDATLRTGPLCFLFFIVKYGYYFGVMVYVLVVRSRSTNVITCKRCKAVVVCTVIPLIFDAVLPLWHRIYISNIGCALSCAYMSYRLYTHVLELSPVWERMMNAVGCGIVNVNAMTGRIVSYNKYAANILDIPDMKVGMRFNAKEYLMGRQVGDERVDVQSMLGDLKPDAEGVNFSLSIVKHDGVVVPIEVTVNLIEDVTGEKLYSYSLLDETEKKNAIQMSVNSHQILCSIGNIYFCNYYIDVKRDTFSEVTSLDFLSSYLGKEGRASETFRLWRETAVLSEYQQDVREFQRLDNLAERFDGKTAISIDYQTKRVGWCRGMFVLVDTDEEGKPAHVLWVARDINDDMLRLEQSQKYRYLYKHDSLTGLYNRYGFNECMENMIRNHPMDGISLLMLDIDFFKKVNDTYGHQNGDVVLRNMAEIIRNIVGEEGTISRWGGEEFMVMLPAEVDAVAIAERLRTGVEESEIYIADACIRITISIGVCVVSKGTQVSVDRLVYSADKCLYEAKHGGRNCVVTNYIVA